MDQVILSIDPGKEKCGIAVLIPHKKVSYQTIVSTDHIEDSVKSCIMQYKPDIIIMGNGTWSQRILSSIQKAAGEKPVVLVNEKHSTEKARIRYFDENPPRGFWKLIPRSLQVPNKPYDDYAAVILAEEYPDNAV